MSTVLEYELRREDLEAFFRHHASHAPYIVARNRRMRWIWGGLLTLLALIYWRLSPAGTLALLLLAVFFLVFYGRLNTWWYVRHNRRVNLGADGPRLGTVKLALADGQLRSETPDGSARVDLDAVRRIDESETHYYLYSGPVTAVIVPRAGDRAEAFVDALRSAWGAAAVPPRAP